MTDHLPYDHEEFHSDFDLWSDNHVKPGYLASQSVRPYPRNPIKRWLFNVLGVRYAEPGIPQGSVVYWDDNVLRVLKSDVNLPVGIAVEDSQYITHGTFRVTAADLPSGYPFVVGVVNEKGQIEIGGQHGTD